MRHPGPSGITKWCTKQVVGSSPGHHPRPSTMPCWGVRGHAMQCETVVQGPLSHLGCDALSAQGIRSSAPMFPASLLSFRCQCWGDSSGIRNFPMSLPVQCARTQKAKSQGVVDQFKDAMSEDSVAAHEVAAFAIRSPPAERNNRKTVIAWGQYLRRYTQKTSQKHGEKESPFTKQTWMEWEKYYNNLCLDRDNEGYKVRLQLWLPVNKYRARERKSNISNEVLEGSQSLKGCAPEDLQALKDRARKRQAGFADKWLEMPTRQDRHYWNGPWMVMTRCLQKKTKRLSSTRTEIHPRAQELQSHASWYLTFGWASSTSARMSGKRGLWDPNHQRHVLVAHAGPTFLW